MKKKKLILPIGIVSGIIILFIASVFVFGAVICEHGYGISSGIIYFAGNGSTYLIDNNDMAMRVSDCSDNAELFNGFENGDKVLLFHDGVETSYPSQTGGYYLLRLAKGNSEYKPEDEILGIYTTDSGKNTSVTEKIDFDVQYIRTGLQNFAGDFPVVSIIGSVDELNAYYEANKDTFCLDYRENSSTDYLDACEKYNAEFFANNALVFIVLEEGSGSTSHNVESVKADTNGTIYINILSVEPEVGTCDMAYWHIMTEIPKISVPAEADNIIVYYNDMIINNNHSHSPVAEEQTVENPVSGYCGNTQTTVYFDNGKSYTFMYDYSVTMTDILINLNYDENKLCKCLPEYKVDTEFGTGYSINLSQGYARSDKGQAELTQEQTNKLKEIIIWAKEEAGISSENTAYPDYSFSLTWNTYGISSYDSSTGILIKTNDATNPEEYKTTLKLSTEQYSAIWQLIEKLDIEDYPDEYNPHNNGVSTPYMTLILSVKADGLDKTVTVKETVLSYETSNAKGQKFLDVCKGIRDILTATDEWLALPEYEFFYD